MSVSNELSVGPAATPPAALQALGATLVEDADEDSNAGASGQRVLGAVRKWWRVALPVGVLLGLAGSAAVFLLFDATYQATAWLKIKSKPQYIVFREDESDREASRYIETQMQLIRSPMVVAPVIAEPEIAQLPEVKEEDDPISWLSSRIEISQMGESELFRISFISKDPHAAAGIVNAVAKSYLGFRSKQETNTKRRILTLLEREKNKHVSEIKRVRTNLIELSRRDTTDMMSLDSPGSDDSSVKQLLVAHLFNASLKELGTESELKVFEERGRVALTESDRLAIERDVAAHPDFAAMLQTIATEKAVLDARSGPLKYPDGDPLVRKLKSSLQARVRELKKLESDLTRALAAKVLNQKRDELEEERASLETQNLAAQAQVKLLRESLQIADGADQSTEAMEIELEKAELSTTEGMQSEISNRITELQVESQAVDRVQLLQPAQAEMIPLKSIPLKKMAVVSLFGFLLPFGIAIGCEHVTKRVCDPQSLEGRVPLALLGEVTALPSDAGGASRRVAERVHMFEESVNSLAMNICLGQGGQKLNTLSVASAVKHEGKSTLASQVGLSLSSALGVPTLLIDGDMRSPSLHEMFDLPNEIGLAEVLEGECTLEEVMQATAEKNLWLVPAGRLRSNPLSLLRGFESLVLDTARESYQYVVIDTPPVLAASESLVLSRSADATVMCALRDVSRENQLREAHRRLVASGANPIGLAVNGVPFKSYLRRYGYYRPYVHDEESPVDADLEMDGGSDLTEEV